MPPILRPERRETQVPLIRVIDGLNEIVGRILSVVALLFAGIIIYDVFMRYALGQPTR